MVDKIFFSLDCSEIIIYSDRQHHIAHFEKKIVAIEAFFPELRAVEKMQWSMHARLSSSLASRHGRYVGRTKFLKKPAYSQRSTLQPASKNLDLRWWLILIHAGIQNCKFDVAYNVEFVSCISPHFSSYLEIKLLIRLHFWLEGFMTRAKFYGILFVIPKIANYGGDEWG